MQFPTLARLLAFGGLLALAAATPQYYRACCTGDDCQNCERHWCYFWNDGCPPGLDVCCIISDGTPGTPDKATGAPISPTATAIANAVAEKLPPFKTAPAVAERDLAAEKSVDVAVTVEVEKTDAAPEDYKACCSDNNCQNCKRENCYFWGFGCPNDMPICCYIHESIPGTPDKRAEQKQTNVLDDPDRVWYNQKGQVINWITPKDTAGLGAK